MWFARGTLILTAPRGSAACRCGRAVDFCRSASVWAEKFLVMSGHAVPADISGHMLDLDEDDDLDVFSKVGAADSSRALRARACTLIYLLELEQPVASVWNRARSCREPESWEQLTSGPGPLEFGVGTTPPNHRIFWRDLKTIFVLWKVLWSGESAFTITFSSGKFRVLFSSLAKPAALKERVTFPSRTWRGRSALIFGSRIPQKQTSRISPRLFPVFLLGGIPSPEESQTEERSLL